ncbi:hypothetical protein VOLCADRAFT_118667 [Volvox carteri f. nagariensis]|uniref:DNA-directed RNA polymerase III subunit RPC6 n=1 Tax=Volvox carteri f. nagariensis TaxID=3068 RepID=D8U6J4_VOLCA|nr:uncharacterized protein VOLCADRAFT_118667 [Volvox carteri f. nagariensis]EFJ44657.1 hypothetical protein VOLCADRAFT_118667 [Volvox carteri f. nagariensis]|eukprot:XP_002954233.1 hypothetical protein VOLCADRAFT_118667 [Volvox carteri f. nagariensis]
MAAARSVEEDLLRLLRQNPQGVTDEALSAALPGVPIEERVNAVNSLLAANRLQLLKNSSNKIVYKEVAAEEAAKFKGLSTEELLLYQCIKAAGNTGMPGITKILKVLESRRLVKSVKNVNNPSRKVYMLSELEPSRELTGGAWYTENQFDSEFINVLREACYSYIKRKDKVSSSLGEIAAFIRSRGFSKVELRIEDIHTIIMTLVYDGRVDEVEPEGDEDEDHYRLAVLGIPDSTSLTDVPCGVCPVAGECAEGGVISPQTCIYYDKWLEF